MRCENHTKYNVSRETRCDRLGAPPFLLCFSAGVPYTPALQQNRPFDPLFFSRLLFFSPAQNKNPQNIAKYLLRSSIFFCRRLFKQKVNKKAVFHVKHRLFIAPRFFLCCLMWSSYTPRHLSFCVCPIYALLFCAFYTCGFSLVFTVVCLSNALLQRFIIDSNHTLKKRLLIAFLQKAPPHCCAALPTPPFLCHQALLPLLQHFRTSFLALSLNGGLEVLGKWVE